MPADHAADALALPDDALLAPGIRHVVATLRAGMRAGPDITTMPLGEARARYAAQQQLWQPRVPPGVTIRRFLIATGAGPSLRWPFMPRAGNCPQRGYSTCMAEAGYWAASTPTSQQWRGWR